MPFWAVTGNFATCRQLETEVGGYRLLCLGQQKH